MEQHLRNANALFDPKLKAKPEASTSQEPKPRRVLIRGRGEAAEAGPAPAPPAEHAAERFLEDLHEALRQLGRIEVVPAPVVAARPRLRVVSAPGAGSAAGPADPTPPRVAAAAPMEVAVVAPPEPPVLTDFGAPWIVEARAPEGLARYVVLANDLADACRRAAAALAARGTGSELLRVARVDGLA